MAPDLAQTVRRAQSGDLDAFEALVAAFQDFVYGLAYHLSGSFEDARDLAQEAFLRAFLRLGDLTDPDRFPGWLRQVAVSVCLNRLPRMRSGSVASPEEPLQNALDVPDPSPGPPALAEAAELREAVLRAVRALPHEYALPLTLYYLDGLSYPAVGEFLGLSPGAVKMRVHRARNMVRKELAGMFEDAWQDKRLTDRFPEDVRRYIEHFEREYDDSCVLLNPEVLRFELDPDSGVMTAVPSGPLRYRNDRQGLIITVHTRRIFLSPHGPFGHHGKSEQIELMEPQSPQQAAEWDRNRRERYAGSLPHFLHAWAYQREQEEGFEIL